MANWDLLLTDARIATMRAGADAYGLVEMGAVAIADGCIAWIGPAAEMPQQAAADTRSLEGRWISPALIDCHTHLVFGGNRAAEFEQRLNGASYEEIARAGGGIMSTVNATRKAGREVLAKTAAVRLQSLQSEGVATIEIKSGYGLDLETEILMLEVARAMDNQCAASISTTFLGAHTIPREFANRSDDYVRFVCDEVLPAVAEHNLADAVDAYCESVAFSVEQVGRVFERAQSLGLPVKLHADQLSDSGGAELAAQFNALSADHLEYSSEAGVKALANSDSVAVLLPGAYLTLGETQLPPIDAMRAMDVSIAVATDCNPGTSPVCSLRAAMNLATRLFRLTPEECLAGVTRQAAKALGLESDRGTLEIGKRADVAVWDIGHPQELSYWLGLNQLDSLYIAGQPA